MPNKMIPLDLDYLVREYAAGRSMADLHLELGVSESTVKARLIGAGIKIVRPKKNLAKRVSLPVAKLVRRYLAGESENALAHSYHVSRETIRLRLVESGVELRGQSASERLKWQRMSKRERAGQVAAAHTTTRGIKIALAPKLKHARTVERRQLHISPSEQDLAMLLAQRGIETIHQQAIGPYNCDLGAFPVAVEIFGGNWHWSGRHLLRTPERFRYILNAGWHILVVKVLPRTHPLTPATADYVATFIQECRRNPSARREYRVIRGAGEILAAGSSDDDDISVIPALTRGRNPHGQYTAVPR